MSNGGQPKTVADWVRYLHTARAVAPDSPDYRDAQEAIAFALQRIRTLQTVANAQEQARAGPDAPVRPASPMTAVGAGLAHGASFGAGEPIAGLLAALIPGGQGFAEGAQQYRQGLENLGAQQPEATVGGEMGGMALTSLLPIAQSVGAGTATAAAIPSTRANMLARFLTGAGQTNVIPGLTLGAIQGFSAGGEDSGDLRARAQGAVAGGATGAAGAAVFGGLGALRVPRWLSTVKREMRQALPKNTPPDVVDGMSEAAIRTQLRQQGYDAQAADRVLAAWRQGQTVAPAVPGPPPPPTLRPGETVQPLAPKPPPVGPRATRTTTPDPLDVPTFQRGVGGHSYSGTYPAGSGAGVPGRAAPSPVGGPTTPQAIQFQQLQMLAQLPAQEFEAAAVLFPPEIIQQIRLLRAQMVGGVLP